MCVWELGSEEWENSSPLDDGILQIGASAFKVKIGWQRDSGRCCVMSFLLFFPHKSGLVSDRMITRSAENSMPAIDKLFLVKIQCIAICLLDIAKCSTLDACAILFPFWWFLFHVHVPLSFSLVYRCSYSPHGAYAQSKLALVLFTYRLQHLLTANGSHVTANVVDPGVVNTELYKHVFWVVKVAIWMTAWLFLKVGVFFIFVLPCPYMVRDAISTEMQKFSEFILI